MFFIVSTASLLPSLSTLCFVLNGGRGGRGAVACLLNDEEKNEG